MLIGGLLITVVFIYATCYYSCIDKKRLSLRDYRLKWKLQ